jgi:signal peptidase II
MSSAGPGLSKRRRVPVHLTERDCARFALIATAVLVVDRSAKAAVDARVPVGDEVAIVGPLSLSHLHNSGLAFGILPGLAPLVTVATLALLPGLVALFIATPRYHPLQLYALALLVGGGAGNVVDRLRAERVTDFIELSAWPAFNVADVSVGVGFLLLIPVAWQVVARVASNGAVCAREP